MKDRVFIITVLGDLNLSLSQRHFSERHCVSNTEFVQSLKRKTEKLRCLFPGMFGVNSILEQVLGNFMIMVNGLSAAGGFGEEETTGRANDA